MNDKATKRKRRRKAKPFFSTGCVLLDCVLGGHGWAENRIVNIVGDFSSNKTGLVIEAMTNFAIKHRDGRIRYAESEHAFDPAFGQQLGLPLDRVEMVRDSAPLVTVEDWYADVVEFAEQCDKPSLYVLDSLDALTTASDRNKEFGKASYGGDKAKHVNELLRKVTGALENKSITLVIVSQIRDKMGVTFGEQHTRTGGKGLDFYASQVLWLYKLKQIKRERTIKGKKVSRTIGINLKAKCKKNKVGPPLRECEMPMYFGYGVDDVETAITYLIETGHADAMEEIGLPKTVKAAKDATSGMSDEEYHQTRLALNKAVPVVWEEMEEMFNMARSKYG